MTLGFFEWNKFSKEYHLGNIPDAFVECSFFLDLEKSQVHLSESLSIQLFPQDAEKPERLLLKDLENMLTNHSRFILSEELRRLAEDKVLKSELQLNFILPSDSVAALFILIKLPNRPHVIGAVHICYELMHEYKQHMDEIMGKLKTSQNINTLILEGSTDYIYQFDLINNICTFSPKAIDVLPIETPTFSNAMERILNFIIPEDRTLFLDTFTPFLTGNSLYHTAEYRVLSKQNEILWISCHGKGMLDDQGRPALIAGSLMDITEQKKAESKIHKMLYYDLLTGLKNRYCYEKEMQTFMSLPEARGSILCLDIKNFKLFNEIFGHNFGNLIIKEFAKILQMYIPENRGIYRLEGDEFLIHLSEYDRKQILSKITVLQVALSKARLIEGHSIYINFTIGIALYPENGTTPEEILKNADTILYKMSKYSNEKVLFFHNETGFDLSKRYTLENLLRIDIENQFANFRVVYQPIVKITASGNYWISAEALLRYFNPMMPDITQEELIETLESTDLIIPVGRWVLQQAITECSLWNKTNPTAAVHVNLAAQQLSDADLLNTLWDVIDKNQFIAKNLICELTETSLIHNFDSALIFCKQLMEKGIGVALDDFGTGYTSFNYLRTLPISQIKLDKSFIQDLKKNDYNRIITSCLYDLCKNIGLELCVEGVETKETLDILTAMGVELIQGFYFERPLEAEVIRKEFPHNNILF